jgi:hypothetical protein
MNRKDTELKVSYKNRLLISYGGERIMIQFLGIHIGTLYFPTSILLITLLVLVGFIIYFLSKRKRNRDQTIHSNENRVKGKRGQDKIL